MKGISVGCEPSRGYYFQEHGMNTLTLCNMFVPAYPEERAELIVPARIAPASYGTSQT